MILIFTISMAPILAAGAVMVQLRLRPAKKPAPALAPATFSRKFCLALPLSSFGLPRPLPTIRSEARFASPSRPQLYHSNSK